MNVMKCKNFRIRTKKYERYFFCKNKNKQITLSECKNCSKLDFKINKPIKKQSKKQKKKEINRYSIITNNLTKCYLCNEKKKDIHEAIGGCNRQKSIEWGLTIPLCRKHHSELENNQKLKRKIQQLGQRTFENKYNHELFMSEFKRNYL